jgi:microsomal dipeptidase-like Zn-dependent dipeptidase
VIGPENICLGGDWTKRLHELMPAPAPPDGLLPPGLTEGTTIAGLSGPEEYPALVTALRSRGWEGEQLDGLLYANLLRLLRESLPA